MPMHDATQVTVLLDRIREGDDQAADQLLPLVYDQLRAMAGAVFGSADGHTLQPTALVHEAWLKLAGSMDRYEGRRHFFAVAAKAMRQVLADHARAATRQKRGGKARTLTLHDPDAVADDNGVDLVGLHECMEKLTRLNERHARVVELRLLGSMTVAEIADTLGISRTTAHGDWNMARAWLRCELAGG